MADLIIYPVDGMTNDKREGFYIEPARGGHSARVWFATVRLHHYGIASKHALVFQLMPATALIADNYDIVENPNLVADVGPDGEPLPEPEPETDPDDEPSDVACARDGCGEFLTAKQAKRKGAKYCSPECRTLAGKQREADKLTAKKNK
jgi:hypothetical protein